MPGFLIPQTSATPLTITDVYTAASEAAMLGLTAAQTGDVVIRTDINKSFILSDNNYSTLSSWKELLTPPDAVTSVDGLTGVVSLSSNYESAGSVDTHSSDTTSVHGIADTSLLATTSYVDTSESDAITSANAYSDSLATNYDAAGSAATAESNANSYTDSSISTHNTDTTSVHGIADTSLLATQTYVDNAITSLVDAAPASLDTLNELAAALNDDSNFSTTVTNSIANKVDKLISTNAQTGTTYTLVLSDASKLVELSNASAITLTVPDNATVAYDVGTKIDLLQTDAGQVTVAGAGGVTINGYSSATKLSGQWAAASLVKRATDTWVLIGNITA